VTAADDRPPATTTAVPTGTSGFAALPSAAEQVVALAVQAVRSHPYGWLVTAGEPAPAARLVQHLTVDDDAVLQIGTSPRSRKVRQVGDGRWATYAVENRSSFAYASLTGPCHLVTDQVERDRAWVSELELFFPAGPGGDDFVLVRIEPQRVEVTDFAAGVHPDPYGLVPQVVERTGDGWGFGSAERSSA